MSERIVSPSKATPVQLMLVCISGNAAGGRVELENTSRDVFEIESEMSPLQYLNLIVKNDAGEVVSEGHYGDCFSPREEPDVLRLQPGEKHVGTVSLFGNVPLHKRVPGTYFIEAVFEYREVRAVAETITLTFGDGA